MPLPAPAAALDIRGLSHRYGAFTVLDDVSFVVRRGEVAGIVGENGAGKTTLFNLLSGILRAPAGTVTLDGRPYAPASYRDAVLRGVSRVFQEQALIPALPVYENILLGHEQRFERLGVRDRGAMVRAARRILDAAELDIDVRRPAAALPFSLRQAIEIARACLLPELVLGIGHPLVLLDEPTSALALEEEEAFFRLLQKMRAKATILFVSHRLSEVLRISDTIHVLKDGRLTASRPSAQLDEAELHRLMVGRERGGGANAPARRHVSDAAPVLAVRGLTLPGAFSDVGFDVRAGEIIGIGGLLDSGKSRLGRALAGLTHTTGGAVRIEAAGVSGSRERSVGYVPAERLAEGVIAALPIAWNVGLASGDRLSTRLGLWRFAKESALAWKAIEDLRIHATGPQQVVGALSGGNQQKVVIARWAIREPAVLVIDNPTRGVDVGAREEIYAVLRAIAGKGAAIVLITDDLPELIGLSDRILVLREGRIVAEIGAPPEGKPSEEALVALMVGAAAGAEPVETEPT